MKDVIDYYLLSFMNTDTEYENYRIFLSSKEKPNFRKVINPEYKANRDKTDTPPLVYTCKNILTKHGEQSIL